MELLSTNDMVGGGLQLGKLPLVPFETGRPHRGQGDTEERGRPLRLAGAGSVSKETSIDACLGQLQDELISVASFPCQNL